jgi:hypothetical protein
LVFGRTEHYILPLVSSLLPSSPPPLFQVKKKRKKDMEKLKQTILKHEKLKLYIPLVCTVLHDVL